MEKLLQVFVDNADLFQQLLVEHLLISFVAIFLGACIGILLGIVISRREKWAGLVLAAVNILYTIPSIALLGFFISITGIGNTTAIITLTLYALLPMVRSTYTGLKTINPLILEAAEGMGSTSNQRLRQIELPLAFPQIMTGLRNMATMTIALAGVASFVGAGGLGVAIYRGITTNQASLTFAGSFLIAVLAIVVDFLLGRVEKSLTSHRKQSSKIKKSLTVFSLLSLAVVGFFIFQPRVDRIHLATKPTTEGYILGEIMKQVIEADTDLSVEITQGVAGGTSNIHTGMVKGEFDLYPEYTGTIWQIVLKNGGTYDESQFSTLASQYQKKFGLVWTNQFGFNDTYGIAVRKDIAEQYQLETISDLAKVANQLVFGAEYDFYEREDGFKALEQAYGMQFKQQVDMDNGLKYQAIKDKKIDAMTVFTTDGQLADADLLVLKDDKKLYPSYQAGGVARQAILDKYPQVKSSLEKLNHILTDTEMATLNNRVETGGEKPEQVAHDFLVEKGLVSK